MYEHDRHTLHDGIGHTCMASCGKNCTILNIIINALTYNKPPNLAKCNVTTYKCMQQQKKTDN